VAVVISVYSIDRANNVVDCIESVRKQTLPPKEIIVVLDPGQALVAYYKKRLGSTVRLIVSDDFGLSSARNMGIKGSNSEIIAFVDDDAVADRDWLKNLVRNFDDSSVIGVGGRIVPVWPIKNPGWFPEELYWIVGCSYKGLPTKKAVIRNPIGCNMIFKRSVFEEVGCFSTSVGRIGSKLLCCDDTEFGIRATSKLAGAKIIYEPDAVVYHLVSENRVSLKYVLKRSYSEGFSKAFVSRSDLANKSTLNTEKDYLRTLLLNTPSILFQSNMRTGASRCRTLWVATTMVFLGYIAGSGLG
jgi:GT2 family glycosyltransferase